MVSDVAVARMPLRVTGSGFLGALVSSGSVRPTLGGVVAGRAPREDLPAGGGRSSSPRACRMTQAGDVEQLAAEALAVCAAGVSSR